MCTEERSKSSNSLHCLAAWKLRYLSVNKFVVEQKCHVTDDVQHFWLLNKEYLTNLHNFCIDWYDNNTASGSKFIECKTMCGFSGTPYTSQIFGRRLHQKTSIGTCGTFIGWPRAAEHTHSFATGHAQPCVASRWTCDGRIHRFTRPLLLTEGWDLWLAPRVKWTSFTPVEETDWMPVQLIISWCSLMVHVLLPAMGSYKVYCFLAKVRAPWRTGRSYRGGQKVDSSKSQFKTVWSLLVKQNVNILIFLHLCWWGTNPFSDFPRERHGW